MLVLRGVLPAIFALAMGALIAAVQQGAAFGALLGSSVSSSSRCRWLAPIHAAVGANLGDRRRRGSTTG